MIFLPIFMFLFFMTLVMVIIFANGKKKKPKYNIQVSEHYRNLALQILSNNEKIDEERKKYNKVNALKAICGGVSLASIFLLMATRHPILILFCIAGALGFIIIAFSQKDSYIFTNILPEIINKYNDKLNYKHSTGIDSHVYREARFESYDRYSSDDYITGVMNDCPFEMSEVHTERRHTDSDGHTSYTTIFHGTFAKVKLNKDFKSFISIINNRLKLFSKDQYITIDNEAFEKIYDVFTDDKIKAMRLLTPDVTTKMIDIYNETGIYCEIKILNNIMYIRLHTGPLFVLNFSNPEKESGLIGKSIAIIDSIFKVMENFLSEIERFDV